MMIYDKTNSLIVIENGQLRTYCLNDKMVWEIGRPAKDNEPDIPMQSKTISRKHGKLQNMDGEWFYIDYNGRNGTVYRNKRIQAGLRGQKMPVMLDNKDVLVFGGGETAVISTKTVWAIYSTKNYEEPWRVIKTDGSSQFCFDDGNTIKRLENPVPGTVVQMDNGMVIYMGELTHIVGKIKVMSN